MKPPFSYHGGKQKMVKKIIPYIPKHNVYVEPFCGGSSLLFAKPDYTTGNKDHYREVLNDTNKKVHNFFVQLRDNGEELCRMLELSLYSQEEHRIAKSYDGYDPLLIAYYFYINVSQSFSNKLEGSWGTSCYSHNHSETYNKKINELKNYVQRIRSIYISCEDALRCIERWDSPQTFFYCDPPYPGTNQGHYKGYTQEDFQKLLDKLESIQGSFILSCYPNDSVNPDWKRVDFELTGGAGNGKDFIKRNKITECIWLRESKETPRKEILDIYYKQKKQTVCESNEYYSLIA